MLGVSNVDEVLTSKEVAEYLRTTPDTIKRMARAGRLPGLKLGRVWRFRRADIDELFTESVVDRELAEEAQRRLAEATDDEFVDWDDLKAEAAELE